jgi:hypothetical protein
MGKLSRLKRTPPALGRHGTPGSSGRTKLSLMLEMLSLASGRPESEFEWVVDSLRHKPHHPANRPLSESEYRATKAELIRELSGIKAWLAQGAWEARADPAFLAELKSVEVSRN